jgi:hypothetical protein
LGREHGWQNPVYTLRTLPEKLHRPDGSPAYRAWTGGLLGVMARQMQDLTGFCRAWFASDVL